MEDGDILQLSEAIEELKEAKKQIDELKKRLHLYEPNEVPSTSEQTCKEEVSTCGQSRVTKLCNKDIRRYSRQLILPEVGVKGQLSLINSSVLIVGAGGLGCPSAVYLAAAGVGTIGIIDYDDVELDNLHRQILHTEERLGKSKSQSIVSSIHHLNSSITCKPHHLQVNNKNALPLIEKYDIVLDCTDNVATRYLLNDACVLAGKPLVSASALRFEGQLTVYNHEGGPCYRCLFPRPPPPEMVTNCSDGGVIGVVPGIMGSLQALEAIKIITGLKASYVQKLLLFDGLSGDFQSIKLRPRKKDCCVCGDTPSVTGLIDYEAFCGAGPSDKCLSLHILSSEDRITAIQLEESLRSNHPPLLVDVRPSVEFEICHLPNSCTHQLNKLINQSGFKTIIFPMLKEDYFFYNHPYVHDKSGLHSSLSIWSHDFKHCPHIPLGTIEKGNSENVTNAICQSASSQGLNQDLSVVIICRRGNESQLAWKLLKTKVPANLYSSLKDLKGGLAAWSHQVNPDFPEY